MSGIETIGLISAAIEGAKICRKMYKTIKDTKEIPGAFHKVSGQLPLVHNTLESAQQTAQDAIAAGSGNANNPGESMLATISSCSKKIEQLKTAFRKARGLCKDGFPFRKGYGAVVEKLGGHKPPG